MPFYVHLFLFVIYLLHVIYNSPFILELYGPKFNDPEVKKRFEYLLETVENQVQYMKKMMEIQGIVQTVLMSTISYDDNEIIVSGH